MNARIATVPDAIAAAEGGASIGIRCWSRELQIPIDFAQGRLSTSLEMTKGKRALPSVLMLDEATAGTSTSAPLCSSRTVSIQPAKSYFGHYPMDEPNDKQIAVSLIVATVGRAHELNRMLASIAGQNLKGVQLIIVDQNSCDRVEHLLADWNGSLSYIHVRSPRGLSRARNVGVKLASGRIVCFPDDDCWYPHDLLAEVVQWFDQHQEYDFLCCTAQDGSGREVASRWPRHSLAIDRDSVLGACASASLFMRKTALDEIGGFDERMGLGAATPFQSAEDSDLALRCMDRGGKGWFAKQLYVYHPHKGAGGAADSRALAYGMGFGYLLRKHRYSPRTLMYHVVRALGGFIKSILLGEPDKARFYWNSANGRLRGYLTAMLDKNLGSEFHRS